MKMSNMTWMGLIWGWFGLSLNLNCMKNSGRDWLALLNNPTRIQPTLSHEQINSFHVFLELFRQIKICYILLAFKYLNLWLQKVWTQDKWGHRAQHTGLETRGDTLPAPATWIFFIQGYICTLPPPPGPPGLPSSSEQSDDMPPSLPEVLCAPGVAPVPGVIWPEPG